MVAIVAIWVTVGRASIAGACRRQSVGPGRIRPGCLATYADLADTVDDDELLSRRRSACLGRQIMGRDEITTILAEMGRITVTCEFCGTTYGYDPMDAHLQFEPLAEEYPNGQ